MADKYWESSPFGKDSIFNPSFDVKKLTVKYISCQNDDTYIYINFDVTAKNLRSSKATIYVKNSDNTVLSPLNNIEISPNGTKSIEVKLQHSSVSLISTFFARVSCDTETTTTEFRITSLQKRKTKDNEVIPEKEFADEKVWEEAIKKLGVSSVDLLKAIAYQESFLEPFIGGEHTPMLYERHRFYEIYKSMYGEENANEISLEFPDLVNKKSGGYGNSLFITNKGYDKIGANNHQFERLKKAIKINKAIAIQSTSFGIFQLLGEYYSYSSATSEEEFFNNMENSEIFQINATIDFLSKDEGKKGFAKALNSKNWELVASIYNGKNWKNQNPDYAKNIENYYKKKPWVK